MANFAIRNLPEEVHRALGVRAAAHNRSLEAEVRAILQAAVQQTVGIGSTLAEIGRSVGGVELEVARDRAVADAADLD